MLTQRKQAERSLDSGESGKGSQLNGEFRAALFAPVLLWVTGYRDVAVIGAAILPNAIGGVVITLLLPRWRNRVPFLLAVGFGAAALGAFTLSVTFGLFGFQETLGGASQWTAAASGMVAILAGAAGARREGYLSGSGLQGVH